MRHKITTPISRVISISYARLTPSIHPVYTASTKTHIVPYSRLSPSDTPKSLHTHVCE